MSARETMVICQVCGHENESDQRFCDECGAELQINADNRQTVSSGGPSLDESSSLETGSGDTVQIQRLLSLGRLNRYFCLLKDLPALLLEETPTAPQLLARRKELLLPLREVEGVWQPREWFEHGTRSFAAGLLPSGPSLDERICNEGALSPDELRALALSLAAFVRELHDKGFLLRSLQPDRIWWDPRNSKIVVDSFERLAPQDNADGDFQVVNGFSPPEAYGVGGAPMGPSSDLYSVGAILHFAGSGQRTDLESRENFFTFTPLKLSGDDVLASCISKLTSKDPQNRLVSAQEFQDYLELDAPPSSPSSRPAGAYRPESAPLTEGQCRYEVALVSHVGCVRSVNQDAGLEMRFQAVEKSETRESHLVVIVDGMGGEAEGDKAASLALRTIAKEVLDASLALQDERVTTPLLPPTRRERNMLVLERALKRANRNIYSYAERDHARRGMGCTITACILEPDEAVLGHVGDTRAYHVRGAEMNRVTTDHSWVGQLVEMGRLTEEEARNHPQRSLILRAMGTNPEVEVDLYHCEIKPGDRLMVSSDGVWEYFEAEELKAVLTADRSPHDIAAHLVNICLERGADDNATLAVVFAY